MKNMLVVMLVTCLTGATVLAGVPTQLNLRVERVSDGLSSFTVAPGDSVDYQVIGSLSDTNNEGIALFIFDASYSCGDLSQMSLPNAECMENFETPLGITNPLGFGGTTEVPNREGDLVQVGGATNTILNDAANAPFPTGAVCLGLGHTELVLATGSLTIPADATDGQMCEVALSDVVVNVVRAGEMDDGTFWAVDAGDQGTIQNMSMTVEFANLMASQPDCDSTLPRSQGNVIRLTFDRPITEPSPGGGEVIIQQIMDGGATGGDISGNFTFSVVGAGDVLRIKETGAVLSNETWYTVRSTGGWAGVAPFKRDYQLLTGDANNDHRVLPNDLSLINSFVSIFVTPPDGSRANINDDNRVLPNDISLANTFVRLFPAPPGKPSDHSCEP